MQNLKIKKLITAQCRLHYRQSPARKNLNLNKTMKSKSICLLLILGALLNSCSNSDLDIIKKTSLKLQDMKTVQYKHDYKNYNFITGELGLSDSAIEVFDFTSNDSIIGARYYFSTKYGDFGFNGLTSFYTKKGKKQLIYTPVNSKKDLIGTQFSIFSIQQLRDLLPQMLNDTAVTFNRMADTVIDNTNCIGFDILMNGKRINMFGHIFQKENETSYYKLFIDKENLLPKQFINLYKKNSPVWIITYSNINSLVTMNDSIFDYSLQKSDYKKYTREEYRIVSMNENILRGNTYLGVKALDWTLPSVAGDYVTLSKIDADLIMLEFWFPGCTGCILAIPDINKIQKKYKYKGLKVYGIEFTKTDSTGLTDYIEKMKIKYPTLYAAKEVASNYGVSAAPSFFLIKEGKFVYARTGFNKNELLNEIEKNLK